MNPEERNRRSIEQLSGALTPRQEQIVEAALARLAIDGLNNLSLRDIAKSLHMQAPAIYWHFKNKEDLIDYMAEAILQRELAVIPARRDDETWQQWLTAHMLQLRKAMLAYPDGGRVVAGAHLYPALTLGRSFEAAAVALTSAGLDDRTTRHIILTATYYTFGAVIEEQAAPTEEQMESTDVHELLKPYPTMARMMEGIWTEGRDEDEDFLAGLRLIIGGVNSQK